MINPVLSSLCVSYNGRLFMTLPGWMFAWQGGAIWWRTDEVCHQRWRHSDGTPSRSTGMHVPVALVHELYGRVGITRRSAALTLFCIMAGRWYTTGRRLLVMGFSGCTGSWAGGKDHWLWRDALTDGHLCCHNGPLHRCSWSWVRSVLPVNKAWCIALRFNLLIT